MQFVEDNDKIKTVQMLYGIQAGFERKRPPMLSREKAQWWNVVEDRRSVQTRR